MVHRCQKRLHAQGLELVHPAVLLVYFVAVLVFCMAAMHPVYIILTCVAALTFNLYLSGWRSLIKSIIWLMPLVVLITLINPLFSSSGATELFRIDTRAVYLESVAFGVFMGLMLVSAIMWFSNASKVLSADKVLSVMGNRVPTIGLMLSMAIKLVPRFIRRGSQIRSAEQATTSAQPYSIKDKTAGYARLVSVLMGWGMEDSLETSDAMRARGWGAAVKRTTYRRYRFRLTDGAIALALAVLALTNMILASIACAQFHFYPTISTLTIWWGYIPYLLMVFLPLMACLVDDAVRGAVS